MEIVILLACIPSAWVVSRPVVKIAEAFGIC